MNESTFLLFLYIYMLLVSDKYSKELLSDFKKQCITLFKSSYSCKEFCFNLYGESLGLPTKEYRLRSNFNKFILENDKLLGYNS